MYALSFSLFLNFAIKYSISKDFGRSSSRETIEFIELQMTCAKGEIIFISAPKNIQYQTNMFTDKTIITRSIRYIKQHV